MGKPRKLGKGGARHGKGKARRLASPGKGMPGKGKKKGRRAADTGTTHRTGSNTVTVDWVNPIAPSVPLGITPPTVKELAALQAVADLRGRATSQLQQQQLQRLDQLQQREQQQLQLLRTSAAVGRRSVSAMRASGRGSRRSSSLSASATMPSRGRSLTRKTTGDATGRADPTQRSRSAAPRCRRVVGPEATATEAPWAKGSRLGRRMQEVTRKRLEQQQQQLQLEQQLLRQRRRKEVRLGHRQRHQEAMTREGPGQKPVARDTDAQPQSKTSDLAIAQRLEREQQDQQRQQQQQQQQQQQPSVDPERPIPPAMFGKEIFGRSGACARPSRRFAAQLTESRAAEAKLAECKARVVLAAKQGKERDALKLEEQEDQRRQVRASSVTPRAPPWAHPPWLKMERGPAASAATAAATAAAAAAEATQDSAFQEMAKEEAAAQLQRLADSNVREAALASAVAKRIRTYANIATAVTTSPFARTADRSKASSRAAPWAKSGGPPQSWQGANSTSTWR